MKTLNNKSTIKVNKTKKILEDALGALLEEKPFEEIRVIDICSKANMHRSTFYTYFNDKYELLKSKLDEYEAKFLEDLQRYKIEDKLKDFHIDIMIKILQYFYFNRKYLKIIFQNNKDNSITKILQKYLEAYVIEGVKDMKLAKPDKPYFFNVMGAFYSGAFITVISEWILNDCTIKPQELAECISDIIMQRIFVYE
ncbi:TetR/AcrR family transcriptional regulator C-terminal domain-containing protein [Brachyspira pilosicoli]|mgnify:FL=1|uniref:Regulatory protein, TetR family n=6 Tax=Brachyspira pilosicoli TaxID=52584 RepID=D8IDX1_BRAP9|nr:TetR/AcrR family transcriptional regulator C-terminal domain-containing protein [Brachyspira pilosicoli]ADK31344.1 regulatory protein, TetR family [Brachyspira pilosicoli 95/1000]AFR71916.1 regulatory protein, TetR family [Brachyspira pilosicoli B2904]AGA66853.1 regulatory protein, TetR family [Brachyspira pilosicoli P43/6/78]MBW5378192.1 TetR family transcriptional regulator [Brachyspira pilosicoli]MBW5392271.1 TetR family transcriptional regulator [Brachyspira pilosicoli]